MLQRKNHIDFLRMISMLGVVYLHVVGYQADSELFIQYPFFYVFFGFLSCMAVPCFFMISGALLLPKTETIRELYVKRVFRFFVVLIVITIVQWLLASYVGDVLISPMGVFFALIGGKLVPCVGFWSIWFLYVYIVVLIFLPILQALVKNLSESVFFYLLAIQFVISLLLPLAHHTIGSGNSSILVYDPSPFRSDCGMPYSPIQAAFFMLLGYYAEHKINVTPLLVSALVVVSIGILLLFPQMEIYTSCADFMPIPCLGFYLLLKYMWRKWEILHSRLWTLLGSGAFVVMLTENIFRLFAQHAVVASLPFGSEYLRLIVFTVITWLVCLSLGVMLKKVPVIKNYI